MSERTRYYVSPNSQHGTWTVKAEGDDPNVREFDTKKEAMVHAQQVAREDGFSQLIVQRKDGTFEEERTYGEDPYPPHG